MLEWAPLVRDLEAGAASSSFSSRAEKAVAVVIRQLGATSGTLYLRDPNGCKMQRVGGHGEGGGEPHCVHPGVGVGGQAWASGSARREGCEGPVAPHEVSVAPLWLGGGAAGLLFARSREPVPLKRLQGAADALAWGLDDSLREHLGFPPACLEDDRLDAAELSGADGLEGAGLALFGPDGALRLANGRFRQIAGAETRSFAALVGEAGRALFARWMSGEPRPLGPRSVMAVVGPRPATPCRVHLRRVQAEGEPRLLVTLDLRAVVGDAQTVVRGSGRGVGVLQRVRAWVREGAGTGRMAGERWLVALRLRGESPLRTLDERTHRLTASLQALLRVGDEALGWFHGAQIVGIRARDAAEAELACRRIAARVRGGASTWVACGVAHVSGDVGVEGLDALVRASSSIDASGQGVSIAWADPEHLRQIIRAQRLAEELDLGLPFASMFMVYQPIVELQSRAVVEVEALIRLRHPDLGLVPPDEFLPVVRRVGRMVELGDWVLDRALEQLALWRVRQPSLRMAINIDPEQLGAGDLVAELGARLSTLGIPVSAVTLELTEEAFGGVDNHDGALQRLAAAGYRLAIDDFGAGYSSLGRLRQVPAAVVKLDRSLLPGAESDPVGWGFLAKVIELVRTLGHEVVAEGVEQEGQAVSARGAGCTLAQGYGLGRPALPERMFLHSSLGAP